LEPSDILYSDIPVWALKRVREISRAQIKIRRLVLAHEAPVEPVKIPWKVASVPEPEPEPAKPGLSSQKTLVIAGAIAGVFLIPFILPILFAGAAILGLAYLDPALIVELEDGTWVEVARWYAPSE
jgi:hypothetical protein